MLSTFEVVINSFVLVLLPIVVVSLVRGSPAPEFGILSKFYHAEKYLNFVGNLFLLALVRRLRSESSACISAISMRAGQSLWIASPACRSWFCFSLFVGLWVRAVLKIRRLRKTNA